MDPAFVDHIHCGYMKDSNKHPAGHQIVQLPQRSKQHLSWMDSLDYLLYDAYSDYIKASESFIIKNG
jgi:hypothetical protein